MATSVFSGKNIPFVLETDLTKVNLKLSGKKSKSVFDFLTYSRETWFSFSYEEVAGLFRLIEASNEIDRVSKFDNSLSFGAKQNALRQIFFALQFFSRFIYEKF